MKGAKKSGSGVMFPRQSLVLTLHFIKAISGRADKLFTQNVKFTFHYFRQ
jgi:hypothetical protein